MGYGDVGDHVEFAEALGGEPKTEMWFVAGADPDAAVYAGLRAGVSRADFGGAECG